MSGTYSNEYKKRDLNLNIGFEKFEEDFYAVPDTMFIKSNTINDTSSLIDNAEKVVIVGNLKMVEP
jgi:hypothetical protein